MKKEKHNQKIIKIVALMLIFTFSCNVKRKEKKTLVFELSGYTVDFYKLPYPLHSSSILYANFLVTNNSKDTITLNNNV
ncbi:MAG: hypothetical protein ACWA41_12800 [Putridiphycobacter sp.]